MTELVNDMKDITKHDFQVFAKVLRAFADAVDSDPEMAAKILNNGDGGKNGKRGGDKVPGCDGGRVRDLDLFAIARKKDKEELALYLAAFNTDELKWLLKKHHLGCVKRKSVESIAAYMADKLKNMTADVFLRHEK